MNVEIIPVTAFKQNCAIFWNDDGIAGIVDPGGEAERLIDFIDSHQLTLDKILLTHGHLDHVGAAQSLKQYFNVDIYGPQIEDQFLFLSLSHQASMFGFPVIDNFAPDIWLEEGQQLSIGNIHFKVLHLPGHTPGHIGFINVENNIAFTGDVLFNRSIGRTDFPRGNHQQLIDSIKQKLFVLNDDLLIIPGHGPATTIGKEKIHNPFLR